MTHGAYLAIWPMCSEDKNEAVTGHARPPEGHIRHVDPRKPCRVLPRRHAEHCISLTAPGIVVYKTEHQCQQSEHWYYQFNGWTGYRTLGANESHSAWETGQVCWRSTDKSLCCGENNECTWCGILRVFGARGQPLPHTLQILSKFQCQTLFC